MFQSKDANPVRNSMENVQINRINDYIAVLRKAGIERAIRLHGSVSIPSKFQIYEFSCESESETEHKRMKVRTNRIKSIGLKLNTIRNSSNEKTHAPSNPHIQISNSILRIDKTLSLSLTDVQKSELLPKIPNDRNILMRCSKTES